MFFTIPTMLTWLRIVAIPVIVVVFAMPLPAEMRNLVATVLFVAVAFVLVNLLVDLFYAYLDPRIRYT
jgi:phosphatidylglycerophosphate synthase